jgi:hypothetical protein
MSPYFHFPALPPPAVRQFVRPQMGKLKLTEGRYLKRTAALLFHPDPLRFVTGAFVKTGFFQSESEIAYLSSASLKMLRKCSLTVRTFTSYSVDCIFWVSQMFSS